MSRSAWLWAIEHGKRVIAAAVACGFLLVLPACGIPQLRAPQSGPAVPETFNGAASPENSSQIRIEEFFNDPTLTDLIHRALAGNQELRILNEDVQIASNEILARRGAYLPLVSLGGGAGLSKISSFTVEGAGIRDDPFRDGHRFPNPLPNFIFSAPVVWQLDIWRQLRNARDSAALRYFATAEGRNYVVTRMVAEIADNYYGLMALDKRLENLDIIIALQEQSLEIARAKFEAARGTDLAVQRFQAEVRKNQSEKLLVQQEIIQVENRINFLAGRFPQAVPRMTGKSIEDFIDLQLNALSVGVPAQLLENRPDIRQAERELAATGLDVRVARANFFPKLIITSGVGYQAFNPKYLLLTPEALIYNIAGDLVAPLINKRAIQADYMTANARQLQAVYNYQRAIINAFTEVINRLAKVQNYLNSIEIKKQQVKALEQSVEDASNLFQNPREGVAVDYLDVLFAQRDLWEARRVLIDVKRDQLSAIVNVYQALGGGAYLFPILNPQGLQPQGWFHFNHSHANPPGANGPVPLPAPPAERAPEPIPPPPPPPERGPFQPPPPPERGLAPPPAPAAPERGPAQPPPPAAAIRRSAPISPPAAAERGPKPNTSLLIMASDNRL